MVGIGSRLGIRYWLDRSKSRRTKYLMTGHYRLLTLLIGLSKESLTVDSASIVLPR